MGEKTAAARLRAIPTWPMSNHDLHWIANYIWGIADDVLRDLYVRGKYRDVILPMTVLRRLDAVLEGSKRAVLEMKARLDEAGLIEQDQALRQAAGQAFYNTSPFTLRDLRARANRQQLEADFRAYLDGFSPNVQDILDNFEFRNQIARLSKSRRARHADREAGLPGRQPQPASGEETPTARSGILASTTTEWARSSRSWSGASTRKTTRRRVSTGPPGTPCG